jgi:glutaminyl-peptide cyclotransferase
MLCVIINGLAITACEKGGPPPFDASSAFQMLVDQCEMGPRYPGSPNHKRLQRYLATKLEAYGANVSLQLFEGILTTGDTLHLINIIGNYNRGARKRVLLGAHYDTRPYADRDPDPVNRSKPIIGANDGASGVAVLLEIARLLGEHEPPIGVDIVLFDGEDYGREGAPRDYILGSTYFANHLKGYQPHAVIVVDMIGERDAEIPMEGFSKAASPHLVEELFSIAERLRVPTFKHVDGVSVIDDHLPFIQRGIPAVDLIDFEYPYWHTLEDTPDKCSAESLEAVGKVLMEYIWRQR